MRRQGLAEDYFQWLYDLIGKQRRTYYILCRLLHQKYFRWFVPNDDNRFGDGVLLKYRFVEEKGMDENHTEIRYFLKGDCTIFELIVGLAIRINDMTFELDRQTDKTSRWFLEMITNLGLSEFIDSYNQNRDFTNVTEMQIDEIVEKLVSRKYDYFGNGGLFPLKRRPPRDQSKEEIWYQLMLYLDENYGL